jgi:anti-sigma B factor antagonist
MTITKTITGNSLLLQLAGRLDTVTSPELGTEIDAITQEIGELILDFAEISYISSAGLRIILAAQKKMNKQGDMKLLHVCPAVKEVFELTGFIDILTIEE